MNWSKFKFEYHFHLGSEQHKNLVSIEAYKEAALNLVLPPDWREQLNKLNRVRAVRGTTALEGNPLSEAEVSRQIDIVDSKVETVEQTKVTKEQLQIRNAESAQTWVMQRFTPDAPLLDCEDILKMHRMITARSDTDHNEAGKWRTFSVQVGSPEMGGVHIGAPHAEIPRLMKEFVEFVNSEKFKGQQPVIRALLAHFFLVTIHPFGDGNGRVSRLVEAGVLFRQGYNVHGFYGLSNYFYQNETQYKTLLQKCRAEHPFNITPFIAFGIEGFARELKGINNFIKTKLNRLVYRNVMYRAFNKPVGSRRRLLNQREHNLLEFLLTETEPTDPFSNNPSRKIKYSELQKDKYVEAAYRNVTRRTFYRELARLADTGFIHFTRDDAAKDWIVELDFGAIGKY
jgi:Fic family protein